MDGPHVAISEDRGGRMGDDVVIGADHLKRFPSFLKLGSDPKAGVEPGGFEAIPAEAAVPEIRAVEPHAFMAEPREGAAMAVAYDDYLTVFVIPSAIGFPFGDFFYDYIV